MASDNPFQPLVKAWHEKVRLSIEHKKTKFQEDATEAMQFFNGPNDFMYASKNATNGRGFVLGSADDMPDPTFRMTVNKVAEMVQIFGPVLYFKNPTRQVNPRKVPSPPIELLGDPTDPMVQMQYQQTILPQLMPQKAVDKARAGLLEFYLNYTPNELNLKENSRQAIDEALIKGAGCLWTELYQQPGSPFRMVGSFFDSIDFLFVDPDMESMEDAKWIARRRIRSVWEVEREKGMKPGTLKGNLESFNSQAMTGAEEDVDYNRRRGLTNDLIVYYEIYSKMGMGARLSGTGSGSNSPNVLGPVAELLDTFGDYVYLEVAEHVNYPLNLPPDLTEAQGVDDQILAALEWPTPFWADDDWPVTVIQFHKIPRQVWPMSHLKPGLGELKFINWAYSFLASKIRTTCRDFIAIKKSAGEELKTAILSGQDLTLLEIEHQHKTITEVVQFLQHPQFNGDIWKCIEAVEMNFEKRVGLTELMYGMSAKQMRSAEEANVKDQQIQARPDDMASRVEDAMTIVARKEAIAARWHITVQDVLPCMGPVGAAMWAQYVMAAEISTVTHELEYRIEAGSAKKPNKDRDAANMAQAMQTLFQPMLQFAMQTGDFTAINKLIADWAKSIDLDPEGYLFKPPPPPPPMPPGPGGPGGPPAAGGAPPSQQGAQPPQRNGQGVPQTSPQPKPVLRR